MKKFFFAITFLFTVGYVCSEEEVKEEVSYQSYQISNDSYDELKGRFFEYFSEIVNTNSLADVSPDGLKSLTVNGNMLLENSLVFAVQFFKVRPKFAVKLLLEKIKEISSEEFEEVKASDVILFKAFYITSYFNTDVAVLLKENADLITEKKIFKYSNSLNPRFSFENLYLPYHLFYSYIASEDISFLEKLCETYLDYEEEELQKLKEKFLPNCSVKEEEREEFKKYTFYLLTIKIFKMHFDALKEGLVKIEDSWNVTRKVRYNLTKIISDIERELKVYE